MEWATVLPCITVQVQGTKHAGSPYYNYHCLGKYQEIESRGVTLHLYQVAVALRGKSSPKLVKGQFIGTIFVQLFLGAAYCDVWSVFSTLGGTRNLGEGDIPSIFGEAYPDVL